MALDIVYIGYSGIMGTTEIWGGSIYCVISLISYLYVVCRDFDILKLIMDSSRNIRKTSPFKEFNRIMVKLGIFNFKMLHFKFHRFF